MESSILKEDSGMDLFNTSYPQPHRENMLSREGGRYQNYHTTNSHAEKVGRRSLSRSPKRIPGRTSLGTVPLPPQWNQLEDFQDLYGENEQMLLENYLQSKHNPQRYSVSCGDIDYGSSVEDKITEYSPTQGVVGRDKYKCYSSSKLKPKNNRTFDWRNPVDYYGYGDVPVESSSIPKRIEHVKAELDTITEEGEYYFIKKARSNGEYSEGVPSAYKKNTENNSQLTKPMEGRVDKYDCRSIEAQFPSRTYSFQRRNNTESSPNFQPNNNDEIYSSNKGNFSCPSLERKTNEKLKLKIYKEALDKIDDTISQLENINVPVNGTHSSDSAIHYPQRYKNNIGSSQNYQSIYREYPEGQYARNGSKLNSRQKNEEKSRAYNELNYQQNYRGEVGGEEVFERLASSEQLTHDF